MTAHVECSPAYTHQPQPLSSTFPLPTPPQPQMTNEKAQHMCHDRCFSFFSLLHKHPLPAGPLQRNCAIAACPTTFAREEAHDWSALLSPPHATRKPLQAQAQATDANSEHTVQKPLLCKKSCARVERRRPAPLKLAGRRPAPPCVSAHCCHNGSLTSTTSALAASQAESHWRS